MQAGVETKWKKSIFSPEIILRWGNDRFGRAGGWRIQLYQGPYELSADTYVLNKDCICNSDKSENKAGKTNGEACKGAKMIPCCYDNSQNVERTSRETQHTPMDTERGLRRGLTSQLRLPVPGNWLVASLRSKVESLKGEHVGSWHDEGIARSRKQTKQRDDFIIGLSSDMKASFGSPIPPVRLKNQKVQNFVDLPISAGTGGIEGGEKGQLFQDFEIGWLWGHKTSQIEATLDRYTQGTRKITNNIDSQG